MQLSSEVQILANVCDLVLLELFAGTTSAAKVTESIEMIGAEKVAGIILRRR